MNEMTTPNVFEPLEQVNSVSTGSVSRPSWNPSFGYDRKQQLENERKKEWEAYQERLKEQDPNQLRLLKLEAAVAELQKRLAAMEAK